MLSYDFVAVLLLFFSQVQVSHSKLRNSVGFVSLIILLSVRRSLLCLCFPMIQCDLLLLSSHFVGGLYPSTWVSFHLLDEEFHISLKKGFVLGIRTFVEKKMKEHKVQQKAKPTERRISLKKGAPTIQNSVNWMITKGLWN